MHTPTHTHTCTHAGTHTCACIGTHAYALCMHMHVRTYTHTALLSDLTQKPRTHSFEAAPSQDNFWDIDYAFSFFRRHRHCSSQDANLTATSQVSILQARLVSYFPSCSSACVERERCPGSISTWRFGKGLLSQAGNQVSQVLQVTLLLWAFGQITSLLWSSRVKLETFPLCLLQGLRVAGNPSGRLSKVKGMVRCVWRALESRKGRRKRDIRKKPQERTFCLWVMSGGKAGC